MRLLVVVILASFTWVACGSAGEPAPGPLDCGVAPPFFDANGDVVQGDGDEGCVRVERTPIALGDDVICKACPYQATRVIARLGDISFDVRDDLSSSDRDDVGALTYEASHHNWADVVTVHGDDEPSTVAPTTLSLRILYDVASDGWDLEILDVGDDGNGDEPLFVLPIVGSR